MLKLLMLAIITAFLLLAEGGMSARTQSRTKRELASPLHLRGIRDPSGSYCQRRGGCCPGRDDQCTVPYLDTICYCDLFCNRTVSDCCPDFWSHCLGTTPPYPPSSCERNGHRFHSGATYKENCNLCTCGQNGRWECEQHACLIEDDMIQEINRRGYGWRATNYSQFWGMTLDEGLQYRLGTQRPSRTIMNMNEIQMNMNGNDHLPSYFNAAEKWPGKIHEPLDQGNCNASWAFSTSAVASDRISIQSMGHMTPQLSPQNLISCDTRHQGGCSGGRVDGAWWYLRRRGVVTEECYPFSPPQQTPADVARCMMQSRAVGRGKRQATAHCPNSYSYHNDIYQSTPPYRLSSNENEIMKEIMDNGPVQAIMEVHEDFFVYKSGIYRHTDVNYLKPSEYRKHATHSVRITGWGEERDYNGRTHKYWIAANSWGKNWGEDGYFRIARGVNECEIETFVIGVWGRVTMEDMHNHHHHHGRRK
ncbi:tubulointerstitial nephritis antigen-like [Carassius auratus]|uniref:Tubulointerstitial nephritis antigen-like n=1 Tax=Carassius auratus TaxID=7957 RepID=A0A6P6LSC3_CARAU|nr:tubulointerstitial nephritis antigen-like [Carassius auratus]XP_026087400.1 tubulointerstitial nephritis antigen-like [Carassius auratus]XP_052388372.1 tubulointerstitial nephritis antigen-like [Carassius gibelio]